MAELPDRGATASAIVPAGTDVTGVAAARVVAISPRPEPALFTVPSRWPARGAFLAPAAVCSVAACAVAAADEPPAPPTFPNPAAALAEAPVSAADFAALVDRLDRAEAEVQSLRTRLDAPLAAGGAAPFADDWATAPAFRPPAPRPVAFQPVAYQDVSPSDQGVADQALEVPGEANEGPYDDVDFDARLRELEGLFDDGEGGGLLADQFDSLTERLDDLEDGTSDFVVRGTSAATARLFGRLHADYAAFPRHTEGIERFEGENPQDRFLFRRLRIGVLGDVRTNMYYKLETEFAQANDFEFRDVYFGFRDLPVLQSLTIGNQKRPFGLDHLNSSRYNVFIARPNVIEAFNEDARRLGIQSFGVSEDLRYNWRYGVFNLERIQDDGIYIGDAYQLQAAGRLATTYWWDEPSDGRGYGHFAISGAVADPDETGGPQNRNEARFRTRPEVRTGNRFLNTGRIPDVERFHLLGMEHVLNYGALQWTSEVQGLWNNRNDGSEDADFWGAYTYVSYFLTGEHMPWSRESGTLGRPKPHEDFFLVNTCDGRRGGGWGAWQIAARFSHIDLNDADVFGGRSDSTTLGLNWYWNQNAGMQFNYVFGRIRDSAVVDGVGGAGPPIDGDFQAANVRFRLDF